MTQPCRLVDLIKKNPSSALSIDDDEIPRRPLTDSRSWKKMRKEGLDRSHPRFEFIANSLQTKNGIVSGSTRPPPQPPSFSCGTDFPTVQIPSSKQIFSRDPLNKCSPQSIQVRIWTCRSLIVCISFRSFFPVDLGI